MRDEMRENGLRRLWADGGAAVNAWLAIPSSYAAEVLAQEAFDGITVDMQHGMVDFQAAVPMLQAISTSDKTPMARVPWNEPAIIMKTLDAGAYGIICPMVNSAAECVRFVGACRYAPEGYRSYGPARGLLYGGSDYAEAANRTVLTLAMVETVEALRNLDEILAVPGLDAIYVGPSDLAISLGFPPQAVPREPEVVRAIDRILEACKRHGRIAGIHCGSGEMAQEMIGKGFQLTSLMNDVRLLSLGAKGAIEAARGRR